MESGQIVAKKYRLNRVLGTGGMATVWAATNIFTERDFAIKMLLPTVATSQEAVDRFLQEAKVSARVNHPNIIEIIDVERSDDGIFLVMELLNGVSLETALRRQSPPMTTTELAFVMVEVARALAAAHRSGVVHRDLKPTNIFLHRERDGKSKPKVLDFGVSKFYEEERQRVRALTIAGTVLGSPMYMSPEQARGESKVDGRSDIFSFGCILFEALCGFRAYDAPNFNALIVKIATGAPRDIDREAPRVPESLREVIKRCLQPTPDLRYATFDEVAEAMMEALPDLEAAPMPLPPPASGYLHADPDATNALPVIRPSDRPPPSLMPPTSKERPASIPSIPPPPGTPTVSTFQSGEHTAPRAVWTNPQVWLVGAGVAVGVVLLSLLVMFAMRGMTSDPAKPEPRTEASAPTPTTVALTTTSSAPPPVTPPPSATPSASPSAPDAVSIDSLPKVTNTSGKRGRLAIGSTPVPCAVTIDGVSRGTTPIAVIELPPGAHKLQCTAKGRTQQVNVNVAEGLSNRHVFHF